jgi:hypothetical protein
MAEKRHLELHLLRVVPHPLREDSMTVGCIVVEPGGEFVDVRFTRDWKRIACFAPDLEMELVEHLESAVRVCAKEIRTREDLIKMMERFAPVFEVGPTKGLLAVDPAAEMGIIERDYLAALKPAEQERRLGRLGIVARMESAFAEAGVLELLQRDIAMSEFTGEHDPFLVDFGFRVGRSLKMFHALALSASREPAVTLAYRYTRIQDGMRKKHQDALLTAVISEEAKRREEVASGVAMLRANEIVVRDVGEMAAIAGEAKRELSA